MRLANLSIPDKELNRKKSTTKNLLDIIFGYLITAKLVHYKSDNRQ